MQKTTQSECGLLVRFFKRFSLDSFTQLFGVSRKTFSVPHFFSIPKLLLVFLSLPLLVACDAAEDESPGITLRPTTVLVYEDQSRPPALFATALTSKPTANVTLSFNNTDPGEATLSTNLIVFTPENWSVFQTVEVQGVDDDETDGETQTLIITEASSSTGV